jgi:hypothetical protein
VEISNKRKNSKNRFDATTLSVGEITNIFLNIDFYFLFYAIKIISVLKIIIIQGIIIRLVARCKDALRILPSCWKLPQPQLF